MIRFTLSIEDDADPEHPIRVAMTSAPETSPPIGEMQTRVARAYAAAYAALVKGERLIDVDAVVYELMLVMHTDAGRRRVEPDDERRHRPAEPRRPVAVRVEPVIAALERYEDEHSDTEPCLEPEVAAVRAKLATAPFDVEGP
jgi:hypothetical protein